MQLKYTWNGDANLDGRLDIDDYILIDSGFLAKLSSYHNGDFNYEGAIDLGDYMLIDQAYGSSRAGEGF